MYAKITEGVQSKLVDLLMSPAAFFWLAGLLAYVDAHRSQVAAYAAQSTKLEEPAVLAISLLLLVIVAFSAAAYEPFNYWVLDRLAGYWGAFDKLGEPLRAALRRRRAALDARYQEARKAGSDASTAEISELERALHGYPSARNIVATRFGCALVASDLRISLKYGLSADVCWPALSLVLSDTARKAVTDAQSAVESSGRLIFWTAASFVWLGSWPAWPDRAIAAIVTLAVLVFAYVQLVARGREYADAYENAFAVGRFALYKALRMKLPDAYANEAGFGKELTAFVLRGVTRAPVVFEDKA